MSDGHDQEDEKPRTVEQVNPGRVKPRKQEEELPTAAYEVWFMQDGEEKMELMRNLPEKATVNNELVRREDGDKAMRVAQRNKYQDGYVNRMEEEQQEVLDLIDQRIEKLREIDAETKGQHNVRAAKLEELEELREEINEGDASE